MKTTVFTGWRSSVVLTPEEPRTPPVWAMLPWSRKETRSRETAGTLPDSPAAAATHAAPWVTAGIRGRQGTAWA